MDIQVGKATEADIQSMDWRRNEDRVPDPKGLQPLLLGARRHIHAHPEAGPDQPETVRYLVERFKGLDVDLRHGAENVGLVVDIRGKMEGPTLAFRADMDALELRESESPEHAPARLGFRSRREGLMHACGHDGHTAILLGFGLHVYENRDKLRGRVRLLFQPGEEGFHGAMRMIERGCMEGVDNVFALHCNPGLKTGEVAFRKGAMLAAVDKFTVTIKGLGGHGAHPESASDQILAMSRAVEGIAGLVSRRISALESAVVTVGYARAGSREARSVLPSEAEFGGTVRTFETRIREEIRAAFYRVCQASAQSVHPECRALIDYESVYPATVNDDRVVERITEILRPCIPEGHLYTEWPPSPGSEDFSIMLQQRPGAMMLLGVRSPQSTAATVPFLHNPDFDMDEEALLFGVRVFSTIAFEFPA